MCPEPLFGPLSCLVIYGSALAICVYISVLIAYGLAWLFGLQRYVEPAVRLLASFGAVILATALLGASSPAFAQTGVPGSKEVTSPSVSQGKLATQDFIDSDGVPKAQEEFIDNPSYAGAPRVWPTAAPTNGANTPFRALPSTPTPGTIGTSPTPTTVPAAKFCSVRIRASNTTAAGPAYVGPSSTMTVGQGWELYPGDTIIGLPAYNHKCDWLYVIAAYGNLAWELTEQP